MNVLHLFADNVFLLFQANEDRFQATRWLLMIFQIISRLNINVRKIQFTGVAEIQIFLDQQACYYAVLESCQQTARDFS